MSRRGPRPNDKRRSTTAEHDLRLVEVDQYWACNPTLTPKQIAEWISATFAVGDRQGFVDAAKIQRLRYQRALDAAELPMRKAEARHLIRGLIDEARDANQYGAAMVGARQLCRIDGLESPKKLEITSNVTVSVERDTLLAVLDAAGLAAYETVLEQIQRAEIDGRLPKALPPGATDLSDLS